MLTIGLFILACGGTEESNKVSKANSKVNPIYIKKAVVEKPQSSGLKATNSSNQQDPSMTKEQMDKAKTIISKVTVEDIEDIKSGKLYKIHCAICHGINGKMKINGAKDLTKSTIPLEEAVAQVYFGKGLMNPFKGKLKDAEIVAVCKYIEEMRD